MVSEVIFISTPWFPDAYILTVNTGTHNGLQVSVIRYPRVNISWPPSLSRHDTKPVSIKWSYPSCSGQLLLSLVQSLSRVQLLRPHELWRARPPCPSPTPGVYPNPCPLSRWCHPTISSSVLPFSSCPQSFPASGSFQMSQLFTSGGQSIEVSASTSVLPMTPRNDLL